MDNEQNLAGLDVISFAKARCRNSLFNNSSKSTLSRRLATLNTFSTVTGCSFIGGDVAGVDGGVAGVCGGVGSWASDFEPVVCLPELVGLLSIVSSAKLSDNVSS